MHRYVLGVFASLCALEGPVLAQCAPEELSGLEPSFNIATNRYGEQVALSDGVAMVSAIRWGFTMIGAFGPGAVSVFRRSAFDTHDWSLAATLTPPAGIHSFGWSLALDGEVAAVGGIQGSTGPYVVHIRERNAGGPDAWGQTATLTNDYFPNVNADQFGRGLDVDGDRIAVGAPYWGDVTYGSVYIFERDAGGPGAWGQAARVLRPGQPSSILSDFGREVSLSGDTLLVGDERAERAHVFERNLGGADNWGLRKTLFAFGAVDGQSLGVALRGSVALVGWRFELASQTSFEVRVYRRNVGGAENWGYVNTILPSASATNTRFGESIALGDRWAVIGAPGDNAAPSASGAVHIFEPAAGGGWTPTQRLTASDTTAQDQFGVDVAVDGDAVLVGNKRNATTSIHLGRAHLFDLVSPAPPVPYCTAGVSSQGCSGTLIGVGTPSATAPGGFDLVATGIDARRSAAIFYGVNGPIAIPVAGTSSWRCVHAPVQRLGIVDSGGTLGGCDGEVRVDWNAYRASHPFALGAPFTAGATVWAQAWNRDSLSPTGLPATQGLSFVLCP